MLDWVPRLSDRTLRVQLMVLLFFSYLYDAVREGHLSARRLWWAGLENELANFQQTKGAKHQHQQQNQQQQQQQHQHQQQQQQDELRGTEGPGECPLVPMPALVRAYQCLSCAYVMYSLVKYSVVCLIQYNALQVPHFYSCYLPGRAAFLFDLVHELPLFMFIIVSYHVIYRFHWLFVSGQLELDCFVFMLYSGPQVQLQQACWARRQASGGPLLDQDRLFCRPRRLAGSGPSHVARLSRQLDHWRKLRRFIELLTVGCVANLLVLSVPITSAILYNLFSNSYFERQYKACHGFAHRPPSQWANQTGPFRWSYADRYRQIGLLADSLDNLLLLIDTVAAMTWPFTAAIICAEDLRLRFEALCAHASSLMGRLEQLQLQRLSGRRRPAGWRASLERLDQELGQCQDEVVDTFEQVERVDVFVSRFSVFCVFCWFFVNLTYQLTSIMSRKLLIPDEIVQGLQVLGLSAITLTFFHMSRPHSQSVRLYRLLCGLAARHQHLTAAKMGWLTVLEHYNSARARHSLHLGSSRLTMANYLKCMVWFISSGLIMFDLFWDRG